MPPPPLVAPMDRLKNSGILKGTYHIIQGVAGQLITAPSPRIHRAAYCLQDHPLHVRSPHKPHIPFADAYNPTHHSHMAPIGLVGLGSRSSFLPSSPPSWPPPHFRRHTLKLSGMLRGEYDNPQSVLKWLIVLTRKPCPGPHSNSRATPSGAYIAQTSYTLH